MHTGAQSIPLRSTAMSTSTKAPKALQKAWIIERQGLPSKALKLRSDWEVPTKLKPGEVLVKVQAAALNPACVEMQSLVDLTLISISLGGTR